MKRIITTALLAMVFALASYAQYADAGNFTRKGSKLLADGTALTEAAKADVLANYAGEDLNALWKQYSTTRAVGMGLTIGGGVATALGLGTALVGGVTSLFGAAIGATTGAVVGSVGGKESSQNAAQQGGSQGAKAGTPIAVGGLVVAGLGVAALGTGIPLLAVNSRKLNGLVDKVNNAPGPDMQVTLVPMAGGAGIAVRF
ncbi:MAG: hypothetical protein IJ795_04700 [Bacteroidales bacterium]|nr:hypothetical protein [Bacteroidales bacterium]